MISNDKDKPNTPPPPPNRSVNEETEPKPPENRFVKDAPEIEKKSDT